MVEGSKALFDRLFVFLFGFLLFFFVDAILGDRFFFLSREKWPWKDGDYVTPTKYCYFLWPQIGLYTRLVLKEIVEQK